MAAVWQPVWTGDLARKNLDRCFLRESVLLRALADHAPETDDAGSPDLAKDRTCDWSGNHLHRLDFVLLSHDHALYTGPAIAWPPPSSMGA